MRLEPLVRLWILIRYTEVPTDDFASLRKLTWKQKTEDGV
jgi:hypothetical protein